MSLLLCKQAVQWNVACIFFRVSPQLLTVLMKRKPFVGGLVESHSVLGKALMPYSPYIVDLSLLFSDRLALDQVRRSTGQRS